MQYRISVGGGEDARMQYRISVVGVRMQECSIGYRWFGGGCQNAVQDISG